MRSTLHVSILTHADLTAAMWSASIRAATASTEGFAGSRARADGNGCAQRLHDQLRSGRGPRLQRSADRGRERMTTAARSGYMVSFGLGGGRVYRGLPIAGESG